MKKFMYFAAALLVLVGCNKKETKNNPNLVSIKGTIELPQGPNKIVAPEGWASATSAFTMQWEGADAIYIYNEGNAAGRKELTNPSIENNIATFTGDALDDMSSYMVAYGFDPAGSTSEYAVPYVADNYRPFAWGDGENTSFWINNFGPVVGLRLKGTASLTKIEVVVSKSGATQATYTMTLAEAIALNATTATKVYFPLNDLGDADQLDINFYDANGLCKTQAIATLPAKNVVTTYPTIEEVNVAPFIINGHEAVQLWAGGPYWATCNIGATAPEEYGLYFAWGETTGYAGSAGHNFSWANAPFNGGNSSYNKDAFNAAKPTACPDGVLLPTYDAASVIWKGDWRMPTKNEFDALLTNCTCTYTQQNNVTGLLCTSNTIANASIFLPAAGNCTDTNFSDSGNVGTYWSSSLNGSVSSADILLILSSSKNVSSMNRRIGLSIRPVCTVE